MNNHKNVFSCDPLRIDDFLQDKLSSGDESALMTHLDACDTCRDRLEHAAADPGTWHEFESALKDEPHDSILLSSVVGFPDDVPATDVPVQIRNVLSVLAPTDDPEMLGRLGPHEISGVIGSGGMGVVLKGHDGSLDRTIAIKVLAPHLATSGAARKRFAREAKAAAAVLHPNVIAIHGVSNDAALPYLVMPYVRGQSLQQRLDQQGPLGTAEILRIGQQIAAGLAAAHSQGLVHRDIKPANIMLEDGVERVTITDFGLARAVDDATMTRSGVIAGTPQYMSPEQARGEAIDARSDLFSMGSVLYAMCTGHSPFRAETSYGVMHRLTHDEPTSICEINPEIPAWLTGIVGRLMSKEPRDRFESALDIARLLEECLAHVQQPTNVPLPEMCHPVPRRTPARKSRRVPFFHSAVFKLITVFAFFVFGVVFVLELNKGTLKIQCEIDDVALRIMQGEKLVKELTVSRAGTAVRIAAGQYVVEIEGETDDIDIKGGIVTLTRGGTKVASIVQVLKPPHGGTQTLDLSQKDNRASHGRFLAVVEEPTAAKSTPNGRPEPGQLQLRVFINVSITDLVRVGYSARIKIDAYPMESFSGKVMAIDVVDPPKVEGIRSSRYEAIVLFDESPKRLLVGMTAEVDIESTESGTGGSQTAVEPAAGSLGELGPALTKRRSAELPSLCELPFRHLPRPSTWSAARYNASLLADGEFQGAVKIASEKQHRIAAIYHTTEAEASTPDGNQPSWESVLDQMHELMTPEQIDRAEQLTLQQMGPNVLLCSDSAMAETVKLTDEQRAQIETQIAVREQILARLEQHFASQAVSPPRTTSDDPLEDPVLKKNWIRYWLDRQFDAEVVGILTPQQADRLGKRLGVRTAPADPWKLFADKHTIRNTIERMTVSIEKPLIHLDPPTKSEVFSAWAEQQRKRGGEVPQTLDDVHAIREKLVDFTAPMQHIETLGEGRLHLVIYAATLYEGGVTAPLGKVYIDIARFYPGVID